MFPIERSEGLNMLFTTNTSQSEGVERLFGSKYVLSVYKSDNRRAFPLPAASKKPRPQSTSKSSEIKSVSTTVEPSSIIQPSFNTETQENIKEAENKLEEIQSTSKEHKIPQNTVHSKPGGYSYEMNKLLFMSSFIELLNEHNIVSPEGVFEDTDITQKLFGLFKQYGINLPDKAVPRFQVTKNCVQYTDNDRK